MLISSPTSDFADPSSGADRGAAPYRHDRLCCALFASVVFAGTAWFWYGELTWAVRMARAAMGGE